MKLDHVWEATGFHGAMIQSVMPWIGVVGKILTGKPHDYFMGKSLWFPVKIFPTKPIHWVMPWNFHFSTIFCRWNPPYFEVGGLVGSGQSARALQTDGVSPRRTWGHGKMMLRIWFIWENYMLDIRRLHIYIHIYGISMVFHPQNGDSSMIIAWGFK